MATQQKVKYVISENGAAHLTEGVTAGDTKTAHLTEGVVGAYYIGNSQESVPHVTCERTSPAHAVEAQNKKEDCSPTSDTTALSQEMASDAPVSASFQTRCFHFPTYMSQQTHGSVGWPLEQGYVYHDGTQLRVGHTVRVYTMGGVFHDNVASSSCVYAGNGPQCVLRQGLLRPCKNCFERTWTNITHEATTIIAASLNQNKTRTAWARHGYLQALGTIVDFNSDQCAYRAVQWLKGVETVSQLKRERTTGPDNFVRCLKVSDLKEFEVHMHILLPSGYHTRLVAGQRAGPVLHLFRNPRGLHCSPGFVSHAQRDRYAAMDVTGDRPVSTGCPLEVGFPRTHERWVSNALLLSRRLLMAGVVMRGYPIFEEWLSANASRFTHPDQCITEDLVGCFENGSIHEVIQMAVVISVALCCVMMHYNYTFGTRIGGFFLNSTNALCAMWMMVDASPIKRLIRLRAVNEVPIFFLMCGARHGIFKVLAEHLFRTDVYKYATWIIFSMSLISMLTLLYRWVHHSISSAAVYRFLHATLYEHALFHVRAEDDPFATSKKVGRERYMYAVDVDSVSQYMSFEATAGYESSCVSADQNVYEIAIQDKRLATGGYKMRMRPLSDARVEYARFASFVLSFADRLTGYRRVLVCPYGESAVRTPPKSEAVASVVALEKRISEMYDQIVSLAEKAGVKPTDATAALLYESRAAARSSLEADEWSHRETVARQCFTTLARVYGQAVEARERAHKKEMLAKARALISARAQLDSSACIAVLAELMQYAVSVPNPDEEIEIDGMLAEYRARMAVVAASAVTLANGGGSCPSCGASGCTKIVSVPNHAEACAARIERFIATTQTDPDNDDDESVTSDLVCADEDVVVPEHPGCYVEPPAPAMMAEARLRMRQGGRVKGATGTSPNKQLDTLYEGEDERFTKFLEYEEYAREAEEKLREKQERCSDRYFADSLEDEDYTEEERTLNRIMADVSDTALYYADGFGREGEEQVQMRAWSRAVQEVWKEASEAERQCMRTSKYFNKYLHRGESCARDCLTAARFLAIVLAAQHRLGDRHDADLYTAVFNARRDGSFFSSTNHNSVIREWIGVHPNAFSKKYESLGRCPEREEVFDTYIAIRRVARAAQLTNEAQQGFKAYHALLAIANDQSSPPETGALSAYFGCGKRPITMRQIANRGMSAVGAAPLLNPVSIDVCTYPSPMIWQSREGVQCAATVNDGRIGGQLVLPGDLSQCQFAFKPESQDRRNPEITVTAPRQATVEASTSTEIHTQITAEAMIRQSPLFPRVDCHLANYNMNETHNAFAGMIYLLKKTVVGNTATLVFRAHFHSNPLSEEGKCTVNIALSTVIEIQGLTFRNATFLQKTIGETKVPEEGVLTITTEPRRARLFNAGPRCAPYKVGDKVRVITPNSQLTSLCDAFGTIEIGASDPTGFVTYNASTGGPGSSGSPVVSAEGLVGFHVGVVDGRNIFAPASRAYEMELPQLIPLDKIVGQQWSAGPWVHGHSTLPNYRTEDKFPQPDATSIFYRYAPRIKSTAGSISTAVEISRASLHSTGLERSDIRRVVEKVVGECIGPYRAEPIPYNELSQYKGDDKSPGYPTQAIYGTFGSLKETMQDPDNTVGEIVRAYEEAVAAGDLPATYYTGAPKNDFHSVKKIRTGRMRALTAPHWVDLLLTIRYTHRIVELVEENDNLFCVSTQKKLIDHYANVVRPMFKVGIDATGFDKTVPADVLEEVVDFLLLRGGCANSDVRQFIVDTMLFSPVFVPGVGMLSAPGGMRSGSFLTSVGNTLAFQCMVQIVRDETGVDFVFKNCSDDSVVAYENEDYQTHQYLLERLSNFGLELKLDYWNGKMYPPGMVPSFLSLAPFEFTMYGGNYQTLVRTDLQRLTSSLSYCGNCTPEESIERARSLGDLISNEFYLRHVLGVSNVLLEDMLTHVFSHGVTERMLLDNAVVAALPGAGKRP